MWYSVRKTCDNSMQKPDAKPLLNIKPAKRLLYCTHANGNNFDVGRKKQRVNSAKGTKCIKHIKVIQCEGAKMLVILRI